MELFSTKIYESAKCTISELFIQGKRQCYIIQDGEVGGALNGKGRIPAGRYRIDFHKQGAFHVRYSKKFPNDHRGMLKLQKVPNFDGILIHIGNTPGDTLGCLLPGLTPFQNRCFLASSEEAYLALYKRIRDCLLAYDKVHITIAY